MLPNPSLSESINPVVAGFVAANQASRTDRKNVMAIMVHGDSSLQGQGVVYETL
jgi:2-oxoglutarate dehydrogenase E1 component